MAEETFVDIQRKGVGNLREIKLTPEDTVIINENPGGLTLEGCLVRIGQWANSSNQHILSRYLAMYKLCKQWAKSGETPDGKVILARRQHKNRQGFIENSLWAEYKKDPHDDREIVNLDRLRQLAEGRSKDLNFITNKGG